MPRTPTPLLVPVILSGGSGTRLWPLSRELHPKQLLPLVNESTLLQDTAHRLEGISDCANPIVVCNEEHRFMVAEQLRQLGIRPAAIVLEPIGRNTAPAAVLAAEEAQRLWPDDDPILLVLPADHVILDGPKFVAAVEVGVEAALAGRLVTFGIVPSAPETGYGYIRSGAPAGKVDVVRPIAEFVEKPDAATAESYIKSGDYYWNSGMFMFGASTYLAEVERFAPAMRSACRRAIEASTRDLDFIRADQEAFSASPSDSIDYAVMEHTDAGVVIPLDAGWSDVGSWSALWEIGAQDEDGNVVYGDVLSSDTRNCYLRADGRLIATIGLEDCVVVDTADALLVARRDRVQDVKSIVGQLRDLQRSEARLHRRVARPWGSYEGIGGSDRYQVKCIIVSPGASLSLQMHYHRAEHWIVVKGTAEVTRGSETFLLSENESTYIPLGETHRLANPGKVPLELIEVQSGAYLGEDDIVRYEDNYGR